MLTTILTLELATAGLNVVLHGRNTTKLEKVQAELKKAHPVRSFRLLVADASLVRGAANLPMNADSGGDHDKDPLLGLDVKAMAKKELDGLHITVLVNNVGGGIKNPLMGDFLEYSHRQNAEAVSKESLFAMHLTHALLPQLRKNRPGGALIISVGSMADVGMPLTAMYSACKAFNKTLFETLALEDKLARVNDGRGNEDERSNVEIMHVRLGDVTDVSWRRGAGTLIMPTPERRRARFLPASGAARVL
ncbi:short chain dehydrogenase/reductase [Apiospora aurea]|uniref:Short chain dehydrogenase/reductase n=1 Tax=Apiospora aurea TaxID=335848 RepID=A0ABR1Q1A7_9PEZI